MSKRNNELKSYQAFCIKTIRGTWFSIASKAQLERAFESGLVTQSDEVQLRRVYR